MDRTRLCTPMIDCLVEDLSRAAQFCSRALGKQIASVYKDCDGRCAELETADDEPIILLQKRLSTNRACAWISRLTISKPTPTPCALNRSARNASFSVTAVGG